MVETLKKTYSLSRFTGVVWVWGVEDSLSVIWQSSVLWFARITVTV